MEKLPRQTLANIPKISTSNSLPFSTPFLSQNTCAPDPFPHSSKVSPKQTIRKSTSRTRRKGMASTTAVSMAVPLTHASQKRVVPSSGAFLKAPLLPLRPSSRAVAASKRNGRFQVGASMKEKVVTGLTAAALTASMMVPDVAEAAVSPSLKNFLLSIAAGGVVAVAIVGAVIGVANFDPVKRS